MADPESVRTGRHRVFVLHAHLVFVTKYRHKVFTARHLPRLEEIMRAVCGDVECELVEFNWPPARTFTTGPKPGALARIP